MNYIWRFYSDSAHQWRWQRLAFDGTVIDQSPASYAQYEGCLANATERGYVFLPSLSTKPESRAPKTKRSYMRLATKGRKPVSKTVTGDQERKADVPIDDTADSFGAE